MKYLMIITCAVLFLSACSNDPVVYPDTLIADGVYKGTFQRTGNAVSNVTLTFSGNTWQGQSDTPLYPAFCNGTFARSGSDSIHFENPCVWTANFDWTLILSNKYKITVNGNQVEITRTYSNGVKDIYLLTKQ